MNDWELIRSYAVDQSESAFRALVDRYAGLVYGSALRQTSNPELARDIAQAVFILLARKAAGFRKEIIISGWLFQTTRFVASRTIRNEQRRHRREQEAIEMQDLNSNDTAWRQMEPVIDTALAELGRADRDAVLIRYVEGQSMREVGARLGVTEDAAKKRVSRAIEKLRDILSRRGVRVSTVVIGAAIATGANAAVPGPVLASIASSIGTMGASGYSGTLVSETIKAWRWAKIRVAGGIAATAIVVATFLALNATRQSGTSERINRTSPAAKASVGESTDVTKLKTSARAAVPAGYQVLSLRAVDSLTGSPITNALVAFCIWTEAGVEDLLDYVTDHSGRCDIPYPPQTGRLDAGIRISGWAARFATWPSEGIAGIPLEYTLRLERTTNVIGGQILDPTGAPLAGAEVWLNASGTGDYSARERPRERFGFLKDLPVQTDAQGRWTMGFVPNNHPGFSVFVTHPQFSKKQIISVSASESGAQTPDAQKLWTAQLITKMEPALVLTGRVLDPQGQPIAGAKIAHAIQEKEFFTDRQGLFQVPGLPEGPWSFTVSADRFAPVRRDVTVAAKSEPEVITLQTGAVLRLRVIDEHDLPVADATVGMEQWGNNRHTLEWRARTDWEGRIEWVSAPPDVDLELFGRKDGFCYTRHVYVQANGQEHVLRLKHALEVYGKVLDADAGFGISHFKAVPGYGPSRGEQHWQGGETVAGTNGLFKLTFGENDRPWHVKIVAEGYEEWVSRALETNELSVTLNVSLKREKQADAVRGVVLNPDGKPAAGVQVALLSLDHNVRLLPKGAFAGNSRWLTTSDEKGAFHFNVNRSAHSVAAVSPDGYAQVRVRDFGESVTLEMQPWGSVSGTIDSAAKKYPVERIELYDPASDNYQGRVSLLGGYTAKPDAAGRFTFDHVPAGEFSAYINSLQGIPFHHKTPLTVIAGQKTEVNIVEQPGVLIKGRLTVSSGDEIDWRKDRLVFDLENMSLRQAPGWNSRDDNKLEAVDYWTSPPAREYLNSRRSIALVIQADGSFESVERVPAGAYLLYAFFKTASGQRKLTITAEQEQLPEFDIGPLELRSRKR